MLQMLLVWPTKRGRMKMIDELMVSRSAAAPATFREALSSASAGESLVIVKIEGDQGFRAKMISLGLMPGAPISIIEGGGGRPFLVGLGGGKFMLDARSAGQILVGRLAGRKREAAL